MSYGISLFEPQFLRRAVAEQLGDWSDAPPLPASALQAIRDRLGTQRFVIETERASYQEWAHPKTEWGLHVSICSNQVAFAIPYWRDWENAAIYAQDEAKALAAATGLGHHDPQSGEVIT